MTDIAQLSYSVDSSGLEAAERALDSQTQAAERTSQAAERLGNRYREIGRRGVEFAESMRKGNESERSLAERAREAAAGIDVKAQATRTAAQELQAMRERVELMRASEEREARAAEAAARAKAMQEVNLRKLLGQIDPTIAKLERLGELEGNLERALDAGIIKPEIFDQYQAKIDATRAATLNMGRAHDAATVAIGRLNLNTVEAQQSLASLARSLATGQWGIATSSITSLTARTGVMSSVFSGAGLAIGGAAAAAGFFGLQAAKGYFEARKLEGVVLGLGNAAGMTAGEVLNLRTEIGRATGDYQSATQAVNQLVLSGKLSGESLELAARSAANIAKLTGQEIGAVTSELIGLADGGSEALARFDQKYNVLTATMWQNIEAIRRQQGELEATKEYLREVERVSAERTEKMREQAGIVERAWFGVRDSVRGAIQAFRDWGRTDLESQLAQARRQMENMRLGAGMSDPETYGPYVQAKAAVEAIEAQIEAERDAERRRDASRQAEMDYMRSAMESERERQTAMANASKAHDDRLARMDREVAKQREINEVMAIFANLAAEDPRRTDGSMERMLADIEKRYANVEKVAREKVKRMSDEERAVDRLLSQFTRQAASMEREIQLHGKTSRAAAVNYDIQTSGLAKINAELADVLEKNAAWLDFLDDMDALDKVWEDTAKEHQKYADKAEKNSDRMAEHTKQAARNMQSHFANFLFDPFENGTKGMVRGFSDALRRMMAEAMAARFFEMIGGALSESGSKFGQWLGGVMGGAREHGGPVHGSKIYRTGEGNKPELLSTPSGQYLIPGEHGRVTPIGHVSGKAGPVSVGPININVTGNASVESASAKPNSSGGFDIDVLLKQVDGYIAGGIANGSGRTGSAIKNRYGLKELV